MTQEGTLDYLPEYLTDEVKQQLLALSKESAPQPAPLEVNESLIRHWCETMEDGNPLYLDEAFARSQGFTGLVAPPGSVMTAFTTPYRWPWPPQDGPPARHIHYPVKELLNLPVGIITEVELETFLPLVIADRVSVSQRLVSISPWRRTRLGEGHFWTMERLYRNQRGELVARESLTAFGYGREDGPAPTKPSDAAGWSPAVEEAIRGDDTGYQPPAVNERVWEDVREGEDLPRLVMPITMTRCVYLASATRDFSPQHSNPEYARQRSKTKDVFVNTPFNLGMVSRFLTDWGGPRSSVRRMKIQMRQNVCAGDDMIITGKVVKKYEDAGEKRVDLEIVIATQDGPATPCTATLALPSRES
ncbi:MAG: MaoC family dehydratase N-terminal domain-containing protein [Dehalococcoidia bacterium]